MFVTIAKLEEPLHLVHEYKPGELGFKSVTARLLDPVFLEALITREGINNAFVEGTVRTEINLICSRCLRDFRKPLVQDFNLYYEPVGVRTKVEEREIKYEDMDVAYYNGVNLDMDQIVLEQIEFFVPMKLVCQDACKGLCEICGADLNAGPCNCARDNVDQRLLPLLEFKKKMKK